MTHLIATHLRNDVKQVSVYSYLGSGGAENLMIL